MANRILEALFPRFLGDVDAERLALSSAAAENDRVGKWRNVPDAAGEEAMKALFIQGEKKRQDDERKRILSELMSAPRPVTQEQDAQLRNPETIAVSPAGEFNSPRKAFEKEYGYSPDTPTSIALEIDKINKTGEITPKFLAGLAAAQKRAETMAGTAGVRQKSEQDFKEKMFEKEQSSVGQKEIDKAAGKDYAEFILAGGYADTKKQLDQLRLTLQGLKKTDTASGPLIGLVPKKGRDIITPEGASIQDDIEDVVQRNLKKVLGAQFTEKEGERLIERAYNPRLKESINRKRVKRLLNQIQEAAKAKEEAGAYMEKHGTLKGFTGKIYRSVDDFNIGGELSEEDKRAKAWSDANPNDPRAILIRQKLEAMEDAE